MKFFLLLVALGALAVWYYASRRKAVRDDLRRDAQLPATDLVRCPKCGAYAPKGQHSCG